MQTKFQLTAVAAEVIWEQGKLLVLYSDGSMKDYSHFSKPDNVTLRHVMNKTSAQIVEICRENNRLHMANVSSNLHLDKTRRFGHGYQHRGY